MNGVIYHVCNGDLYIQFTDRIQAFRYARACGSKKVFMEVPDQVDWYYWDWGTKRWVYP